MSSPPIRSYAVRAYFTSWIQPKQVVRVVTQYASAPCKLPISSHLFARWHLIRHVGYLRHQQQVDFRPFDLESGIRVACDVGYLCANIENLVYLGLSVLELGPTYATDRRQTSDRRQTKASLNAFALWGRRHNKCRPNQFCANCT